MKKSRQKTPNAQRQTPNVEWQANGHRVAERADQYCATRQYDLEDRLLEFATSIVELVDSLPNSRAANYIAGQLLRCGTSPLSHHGEVEAAESRKDFLHKLRICLKELRETKRWLRLIGRLELAESSLLAQCLNGSDELIRIFRASINTTEKNDK